jgi:hypothetical protein
MGLFPAAPLSTKNIITRSAMISIIPNIDMTFDASGFIIGTKSTGSI